MIGEMEKKYQVVEPLVGRSIEEQWNDCIQQIDSQINDSWTPFKLTIFVSAANDAEYLTINQSIQQWMLKKYGDKSPTFAVVSQPPLASHLLQMEVIYANATQCNIIYKQSNHKPYIVLTHNDYREIWASGLGSEFNSDVTDISAKSAFEEVKQVLDSESISFNNIVRQWNYIAQILSFKENNDQKYQHYQLFNEVRSEFYGKYRTVKGYPAATGIGTQSGGVMIDICAIDPIIENQAIAIDNPLQRLPYQYSQSLLEGEAIAGKSCKQAPQFERAKLVKNHSTNTLFVSGTAAIVGENTIGINDIEQQTNTTLHHISQLVSVENLIFHKIEMPNTHIEPKSVRVYIKNEADFKKVQNICNQSFNIQTITYIQADVCRDNLLVEIEAEYVMQTC